jgi:DNA-binding NtrC family response regulator
MRALRLRAFDLVAKPFAANQILETVRRAALRCETRRGTSSSYEVLDGLTNRLIESVHGLSALELQRLARSKQEQLVDLRAQAQKLLGRLSDARVSRARKA